MFIFVNILISVCLSIGVYAFGLFATELMDTHTPNHRTTETA